MSKRTATPTTPDNNDTGELDVLEFLVNELIGITRHTHSFEDDPIKKQRQLERNAAAKQKAMAGIQAHYSRQQKAAVEAARIDELEKSHDYIEDTYMVLTNDLPALLEQDRVFEIRKQHKAELHKNIDERILELQAGLTKEKE